MLLTAVLAACCIMTTQALTVTEADGKTTISNEAGWSQEYTTAKVSKDAFNAGSEATILTQSKEIDVQNAANLTNAGDIIIDANGQLVLQTWSTAHGNATSGHDIEVRNNIYLGTTSTYQDAWGTTKPTAALELKTYSGKISLKGTINLLNNSTITNENNGSVNDITFDGAVNGADYVLSFENGWAKTTFNGGLNLKGMIFDSSHSDQYKNSITITGENNTVGYIRQNWGLNLTVSGLLEVTGEDGLTMSSSSEDKIDGAGTIRTSKLDLRNTGKYSIEVNRLEIGEGGITSSYAPDGLAVYMGATTIATNYTWEYNQNIQLYDTEKGTTFEIGANKNVSLGGVISDKGDLSGKLVKTGAGELTLSNANTYTGGTEIKGGTLTVNNSKALGEGSVSINNGTLKLNVDYTLSETTFSKGKIDLNGYTLTATTITSADTGVNAGDCFYVAGGAGSKLVVTDMVLQNQNLTWADNSSATVELNGNNEVRVVDFQSMSAGASLVLKASSQTKINSSVTSGAGALWMKSGASVLLEKGATLTSGFATVTGRDAATQADATSITGDGNTSVWSNGVYRNADISVTGNNNHFLTSQFINSSLSNNTEGITLILNHDNNSLSGLHATTGHINIQKMQQLELAALSVGKNMSVGVHSGEQGLENTANAGTVTVSGSAAFGEGAQLYVDGLTLKNQSSLTLSGALTMNGGDLTLGSDIILDTATLTSITGMADEAQVNLFTGVDALTVNGTSYTTLTMDSGITLSQVFASKALEGYYLGYADGNVYAGKISTPAVPEPTTATLSLLALAGLVMRRRRK